MRNGTLTLDTIVKVADALSVKAMITIAESREGDPAKFGPFSIGQIEAGLNHFLASVPPEERESVFEAIVRGGTRAVVTLEEVIKLLIDRNGRGIPIKPKVTANVCDPNRSFYLEAFNLVDPTGLITMMVSYQKLFSQSPLGGLVDEYTRRFNAIRAKVAANPCIANLFVGPSYPVILPQIPEGDYGKAVLEDFILPVVKASYEAAFPGRKFINRREGQLKFNNRREGQFKSQVTIVDERHQQLVTDLTKNPIVGILTLPLQGFSVHAQRQFAKLMPEGISLAGPIEIGVGEALYPKHLSRDNNTPVKDCSAVQWRGSGLSLCFDASDGKLEFDFGYGLGGAYAVSSGALFVRW